MGKKICFVTTTSVTLKTFVIDTAVLLHEKLDMDITFVCDEDLQLPEILPSFIRYIPVSMKRGIDLSGVKSLLKLVRLFKMEKFDIVQYSTPNAALYASWASKIASVPVRLYAQWGIRYVGFTGKKRTLFKTIEKFVCRNSTDIRAVSPMNLDFAVSEGLYSKEKGKVLGVGGTIGVEMKEYPLENKAQWRDTIRNSLGMSDGFVYGFAGRLSRDKGGNELLKAMRRLSETESQTRLLIVGPDETNSDMDTELIQWAKSCGRVVFTGFINKQNMPQYYAAMDALVHPTYREGFGMVLQEAGAMALPILTTNIPGASEVMEEGVSCLLVEPKDSESLYKAMLQLSTDKEAAEKIGEQARKRAELYFDRPIMLGNQLKDYTDLVNE